MSKTPTTYEPVSRFWACVFSWTIFALFWTLKIDMTKKWLLQCVAPLVVLGFCELLPFPVSTFAMIGTVIVIINSVRLMYKWTSEYNLKTYGYESKTMYYMSKKDGHNEDESHTGTQPTSQGNSFCGNCGISLEKKLAFCVKCGAKTNSESNHDKA